MRATLVLFFLVISSLLVGNAGRAQVSPSAPPTPLAPVENGRMVTLAGNTHPAIRSGRDLGRVSDRFLIRHAFLQLKRSAAQQAALDQYLQELQDPNSPNYHRWLTAAEFGERFGLAQADLDAVTSYLTAHGLVVHATYPNLAVDFSGTAGQVARAFHTEIHRWRAAGQLHFANIGDPQIPAALAPMIEGVASLHDFLPRPLHHAVPLFTIRADRQAVVPADLATIYGFGPAFSAGLTGRGQTIATIEDSDIYSPGDWAVFRKVFGLARRSSEGRLLTVHPSAPNGQPCLAPGVNGDVAEAMIDAEWATAAAPDATIVVASCANTATFGGFIALQNLVAGDTPPDIVSIGYGQAEVALGTANNAFVNSLYQMAAAEGVSIFVSAGDSGAAFTDNGNVVATHGIAVNGYASTPYNVAVGATDFADSYLGTIGSYWSNTNSPVYGSALSYIPEIPWNSSCASGLLAAANGFSSAYGVGGYCNNGGPITLFASGGGPSGCASGSPAPGGIVGGTCAGYAKPVWQAIPGNPADGVRDLPDVAAFGGNGVWGHYAVVCLSDPAHGGRSCLGDPSTWNGFGGTSVGAPVWAGIQALINQKTGARWGNPAPIYYQIAAREFASASPVACDVNGAAIDFGCSFHDITSGDTDVVCAGPNHCYAGPNPGTYGVLSLSPAEFQPAFSATPGWDFATGIGTVNVTRLLATWPPAQ